MKYLKSFNESIESSEISELISSKFEDVKDCFINVSDLTHVKLVKGYTNYSKKDIEFDKITVVVNLDASVVDINRMNQTEWGVKYRQVINGDEITKELVDSIIRCKGYTGLKIGKAEVKWVNAGEFGQSGNQSTGPGYLEKGFRVGGNIGPIHKPSKGAYSIDLLTDFILDKGDRLRHLKIEFVL